MKKSNTRGGLGEQSPLIRKQWQDRLETGKAAINLSAPKIQALLGVARSRAERETLLKVLAIIQK